MPFSALSFTSQVLLQATARNLAARGSVWHCWRGCRAPAGAHGSPASPGARIAPITSKQQTPTWHRVNELVVRDFGSKVVC